MARPATLARLAAAALLLPALSATPQTASSPRADLEAVASALDRAVREAGAPGIATIGGSITRAYVLPGGGAMFVLPPRALPSGRRKVDMGPRSVRALREAMAHLQDTLSRVREPEMRAQIQRSVEALRRAQAELRRVKPVVPPLPPLAPPPPPGEGPVALGVPDAEELAAAIEEHVARQMRAFDQAQRAQGAAWQRQWEAQVRALAEQSDAFRREAQRAQEEAERALQEQLAAWPALAGEPPAAAPSLPPEPAPPAVAAPPAPPAAPAPPAPAAPPAVAAPAAPWSLWLDLDLGEGEPADAEGHVARVREAVLGVLEAEAPRLARLATEGSVAVAVDFVPRGPLPRRVSRTLVLRVPRKDLADRAAGRLSGGEFRRRVTASDY